MNNDYTVTMTGPDGSGFTWTVKESEFYAMDMYAALKESLGEPEMFLPNEGGSNE